MAEDKKAAFSESDDFDAMMRHLSGAEELKPVYFFYGDDGFQSDTLVRALVRRRFGDGCPDKMCYELIQSSERGAEDDIRAAVNAVRNISMFSGPKLVVFRGAEKLKEKESDHPLQVLYDYARHPARGTLVVQMYGKPDRAKPKKTKAAAKTESKKVTWSDILPYMAAANCPPLGFSRKPWEGDKLRSDIAEYAVRHARENWNMKVDQAAAVYLAGCIGPDRAMLHAALDKLSLCVAPGGSLDLATVREQIADTRERSYNELTEAIEQRNPAKCLEALLVLSEQAHTPSDLVAITAIIATPVRKALLYKLCAERQMTDLETAGCFGYTSANSLYPVKKMAEKYSLHELKRLHRALFDTDRALKSSAIPNALILSRVLLNILPTR